MSTGHLIVSAVCELTEDPEGFWNNTTVQTVLEDITPTGLDKEWRQFEGKFRSSIKQERYPARICYHSHRESDVIEITIQNKRDITQTGITNPDQILAEINNQFNREFHLEVYYWYDGTDRPGAAF